jgi:hypothetical protein
MRLLKHVVRRSKVKKWAGSQKVAKAKVRKQKAERFLAFSLCSPMEIPALIRRAIYNYVYVV